MRSTAASPSLGRRGDHRHCRGGNRDGAAEAGGWGGRSERPPIPGFHQSTPEKWASVTPPRAVRREGGRCGSPQPLCSAQRASLPVRRGGRQRPSGGQPGRGHVPCGMPGWHGTLRRATRGGGCVTRGRAVAGSGAGTASCAGPLEHSPLGKASQASLQPAQSRPRPAGRRVPGTARPLPL